MMIADALKHYLREVLGIQLQLHPWKKEKKIPFFLRELYAFYEGVVLDKPCLFIIAREEDETSPAVVSKHLKQLRELWTDFCIYVRPNITTYNRKRLIEKQIAFIVPGKQMYMPQLCLDLREHYRKEPRSKKNLSPAAQAVIIHALLHQEKKTWSPSELAKELKYSRMTLTRAFNELELMDLCKIVQKGKQRLLEFHQQRLWEETKPLMRNPEKKTVFLKHRGRKKIEKIGVISGLTALSSLTMLNPPKLPVYAISMEDWKKFEESKDFEEVFYPDDADFELQIWSYDPKLFATGGMVDSYSLYANLKDSGDERIETSLENLMEKR